MLTTFFFAEYTHSVVLNHHFTQEYAHKKESCQNQ